MMLATRFSTSAFIALFVVGGRGHSGTGEKNDDETRPNPGGTSLAVPPHTITHTLSLSHHPDDMLRVRWEGQRVVLRTYDGEGGCSYMDDYEFDWTSDGGSPTSYGGCASSAGNSMAMKVRLRRVLSSGFAANACRLPSLLRQPHTPTHSLVLRPTTTPTGEVVG